ncbi:MAG: NADP-specific glutamate dehydrogenase [Clostridiaceae bacterium]|nr:NADP-specific glutamate dehydrogenase [Clostridia bacterium]MDY3871532.1 NADP-specific glutamate dehydrogenase [Clostridiaceae bacterium]
MNAYMQRVLDEVKARNPHEKLFLQTVEEVFESLEPIVEKNSDLYEKYAVLERMCEPDRQIQFRVTWVDDAGKPHVNRGFRVQFNSAIGPYKGGLRFASDVTLDTMKFLGFEQTFKNSLTSLPIGGGKGGSDFSPIGKSDMEVMRFCQAFMTELWRHIGPDVDVPAGDIGVGGREIGFLYGQYKRIKAVWENGVLTGKGFSYGGSLIRPEATGYGAVYYLQEVLKHEGESIEGKRIAVSGYGNVGWGIMKKAAQLGAKVTYFAGPDGYIHDPDGVVGDKLDYILEMRAKDPMHCKPYADKYGVEFVPGTKCWGVKDVDIYMPAATQNDVNEEWAQKIIDSGVKYYIEVANMPTTNEALAMLRNCGHIIVAPSKAVNAGGVATSAFEMSQNSERLSWTAEEVDEKLHHTMKNIYAASVEAAEKAGLGYDLVAGGNIAGFLRVADAMIAQGLV